MANNLDNRIPQAKFKKYQFITTIFNFEFVSIKLNSICVCRFGVKEHDIFDNHSGISNTLRCRDYHTIFETSICKLDLMFLNS